MRPRRVLYFSRDYTTHDRRFLAALAGHGYEMLFLRLESDGTCYEPRPLPEGVWPVEWAGGVSPAPTPKDWLGLLPALQEVVSDTKPELVHAGPVPSCAFMAATVGCRPLLAASWGSDLLVDVEADPQQRALAQYALANADAFLCDASVVRERALALHPLSSEQIVQFPWGIDLEQFAPSGAGRVLRERLGWQSRRVVLSTRTWDTVYGIDVVLESFRRAAVVDPELRLLLIGDGPARDAVGAFIAQHGLRDRVNCPGRVSQEDLAAYYQAADVYLSCSHSDGVSISLLEALACGLPAVVTDIPGNREWVTAGENGWLAEDGSCEAFASAIARAAALSAAERSQISEANRTVARERADWNKNILLLTQAYDGLIG